MAKNDRLGKLKGVLKRWHSFSRLSSSSSSSSAAASAASAAGGRNTITLCRSSTVINEKATPTTAGLHPVLVGKSRRPYLVRPELAGHPVFRRLARPADGAGDEATVVGCEVVFFEHLLWMLENGDSAAESLDEIVEFYEC